MVLVVSIGFVICHMICVFVIFESMRYVICVWDLPPTFGFAMAAHPVHYLAIHVASFPNICMVVLDLRIPFCWAQKMLLP